MPNYSGKSFDVVGYTYGTENYCPGDMVATLPTGPGEAFDGWAIAPGVRVDPVDNIAEIAQAFGFTDESRFDSSEFPKVIFRDSVTDDDTCAVCGEHLGD